MWDAHTNEMIREFIGHADWVSRCVYECINGWQVWCVSISPSAKWILSGSRDDTVRIWNVTDGTLIEEVKQHNDTV